MNPFLSQSMHASWVSRSVRSAGDPPLSWSSGNACSHLCRCRAGAPCQCAGACSAAGAPHARQSWRLPPPAVRATFADAGLVGEFGPARRGGYGVGSQIRSRRRDGYPQSPGFSGFRRGWTSPPYQSSAARRRPTAWPARRQQARRIARALRLNHHYARRLGWGPHARQIAGRLGSPTALPWSFPFARAVARWQRGVGAPVTGVITPDVWARLRASLMGDQLTTPPPDQPSPRRASGMADEPMAAGLPSPGMEPMDQPDAAPPPDAGADSGAGDAAPPDVGTAGDDAGGANEWGWSARW